MPVFVSRAIAWGGLVQRLLLSSETIDKYIRFRRRRDDLSKVPDLEKFSGVSSDDEHDLAF